jgi:hypothetical protein
LAWMPRKNDFVVPILGSRKLECIQETWAPPTST